MPRPPDILIAGAQKAGTTTLHYSLRHHPQVRVAVDPDTGKSVKEVHFFDGKWERGVDWYRDHFREPGGLCIDATPNYLSTERAHARLADVAPDAKVIVTLRHPVDRAFSAFNHYTQLLPKTESWDWPAPGGTFEENVEAELAAGPGAPWEGLLGRGNYAPQLASLFRVVPRERVLVLILERWSPRFGRTLREIADFLGIARKRLPRKVRHRREKSIPPMGADLRARLEQHFAPSIEALRDLLDDELAEWSATKVRRRTFLRGTAGLAAAPLLPALPPTAQRDEQQTEEGAPKPPRGVLVLTADDLAAESVGCFGCGIEDITPHIDRLAQAGARFEHAHVSVSACQPSRTAMLTGREPHRSGATGFKPIRGDLPTLPSILKGAGYYTGVLSKVEHLAPPASFPFDVRVFSNDLGRGRAPKLFGERAAQFFEEVVKKEQPFFLLANADDPHRPFPGSAAERKAGARNRKVPFPPARRTIDPEEVEVPPYLPDLPDVRGELAEYYAGVHRCDETIGAVLGALQKSGLADETLVVFLSDNGMSFPFGKAACYRFSTRTPLLVRWPGRVTPGTVDTNTLIAGVDLFPTLLEVLGIAPPDGLDGVSFAPKLAGAEHDARRYVFTSYHETSGRRPFPMRAVHDRRYGYVFHAWSDGETDFHNEQRTSRTVKAMRTSGDPFVEARLDHFFRRSPEELYDYEKDPGARANLLRSPAMKDKLAELRGALVAHMEATGDPLLEDLHTRIRSR